MICNLIKFVNLLYMSSNNSLFFFENSDVPIYLSIGELLKVEIPQRSWDLVFTLVIEQDCEGIGVVIDFKNSSH